MTKAEFKERIKKQQWYDTDFDATWQRPEGPSAFFGVGMTMVQTGMFTYTEALAMMGDLYRAVSGEYGG